MSDKDKNTENNEEFLAPDKKPVNENTILQNVVSGKQSNYEITLINENLLLIKVSSIKSVNINCSIKDSSAASENSGDLKTNNILIHSKPDNSIQDIEIYITLGELEIKKKEIEKPDLKRGQLIPNPEVAFLIEKPGKLEPIIRSPEMILEEKLGRKNPYHISREIYKKNMTRGIIASLIITFILVFTFYGMASKTETDIEETPRLLVLQDINEPKPPVSNVHDPVKPPEEDKKNISDEIKKKVNISKNSNPIKPVKRKETNPIDTALLNTEKRKLDSIEMAINRKKYLEDSVKQLTENNTKEDTNKTFGSGDKSSYSSDALGIICDYPKDWKMITQTQFTVGSLIFQDTIDNSVTFFITSGKSQHYDKFRDKLEPANKFDMGDDKYEAYKVELPGTEKENVLLIYYFKFNKMDFTCMADVKLNFYNDDLKAKLDKTVRSIRITKTN
jgi:hypothetical protein